MTKRTEKNMENISVRMIKATGISWTNWSEILRISLQLYIVDIEKSSKKKIKTRNAEGKPSMIRQENLKIRLKES